MFAVYSLIFAVAWLFGLENFKKTQQLLGTGWKEKLGQFPKTTVYS